MIAHLKIKIIKFPLLTLLLLIATALNSQSFNAVVSYYRTDLKLADNKLTEETEIEIK